MNTKFEIIEHSDNLPFSIFLHESNLVYPMNWHKEIEILFVLKGTISVKIKDISYTVTEDNIILVNSYEMHEITPLDEDIIILVFQLDPYFYQKYYKGFTEIVFHLNSTILNKDINIYNTIKENLVIMMWYRLNKENTYEIKLLKQSLALVELLLRYFKKPMIDNRKHNDRLEQRLISIIENINKNYNKKLTLSHIAEQEYISIHYLSKFFKNKVGIGFNKYLNLFRLNKSMNDLLNSNKMIIDIALEHGFSSVKAYTKIFKETYKETPSSFRKKYLHNISPKKKSTSCTINSKAILHNYIELLAKDFLSGNLNQILSLDIDMHNKSSNIFHKESIVNIEMSNYTINSISKEILPTILKEIDIDYIRFEDILSKKITLFNHDKSINWFNIDIILEFLISINVKPFIKLPYNEKYYTMKQWQSIVIKLIDHCSEKYGAYNIHNWKFEISCSSSYYDKLIILYETVIKKIIATYDELQLGISVNLNNYLTVDNIVNNFDFTNLEFVTIEIPELYCNNTKIINSLVDYFKSKEITTYIYHNRPNNELYDTCFISSHFINHYLNTYRNANLIMTFIDPMISNKIFNGKDSLLTYNGLKKPLYNTYFLLNKIKGTIIDMGDYYVVVKNKDRYYILLYHFDNNNNIFIYNDLEVNYNTVSKQVSKNISSIVYLNLKLLKGKYKIRTYLLNEKNGCIFKEWLNMGSPMQIDKEDYQFLKSKEYMRINIANVTIDESLHLESSINLNEIRLIEIIKK